MLKESLDVVTLLVSQLFLQHVFQWLLVSVPSSSAPWVGNFIIPIVSHKCSQYLCAWTWNKVYFCDQFTVVHLYKHLTTVRYSYVHLPLMIFSINFMIAIPQVPWNKCLFSSSSLLFSSPKIRTFFYSIHNIHFPPFFNHLFLIHFLYTWRLSLHLGGACNLSPFDTIFNALLYMTHWEKSILRDLVEMAFLETIPFINHHMNGIAVLKTALDTLPYLWLFWDCFWGMLEHSSGEKCCHIQQTFR